LDVSIILPTYNERDNIGDLIDAIETVLRPFDWSVEVVVVDDNSPDGTAELVRTRLSKPGFGIVCYQRLDERGLATAIKHGIKHSTGDIIVVMDTDFNHDPEMIPQMVKFLEYYDMVIGSRFVMGGGMEDRRRYYNSLFYNLFVRLVLRLQVQDNLSGFFAIRRERLKQLKLGSVFWGYGEYFIRLLYAARLSGYRMLEVPVFYILRRHGQSKSRFLVMLRDYTRCVFSVWYQSVVLHRSLKRQEIEE
jgi:dolichol-phosphate mannosyltransferase